MRVSSVRDADCPDERKLRRRPILTLCRACLEYLCNDHVICAHCHGNRLIESEEYKRRSLRFHEARLKIMCIAGERLTR